MSTRQPQPGSSASDRILDLLLEALIERQAFHKGQIAPEVAESSLTSPTEGLVASDASTSLSSGTGSDRPPRAPARKPAAAAQSSPGDGVTDGASPVASRAVPQPGDRDWTPPPPLPSINLGPTLGRLLFLLTLLVVLVNIPVNRYGTSLARIMPDSASLVIRDGLVLKGTGTDVYVLQDNKLRWISSLEAFEYFGYQWDQVRSVDDRFLEQFELGHPIHVLLKCHGSPHIYALEDGTKRWITDIVTFESEGYVWDDVKLVACEYLRGLPDGVPIPEDAGPPPQP
jgi:hypothetical protein